MPSQYSNFYFKAQTIPLSFLNDHYGVVFKGQPNVCPGWDGGFEVRLDVHAGVPHGYFNVWPGAIGIVG